MQFLLAEMTQVEVNHTPRGGDGAAFYAIRARKPGYLSRVPVPYGLFWLAQRRFGAYAVVLQVTVAILLTRIPPRRGNLRSSDTGTRQAGRVIPNEFHITRSGNARLSAPCPSRRR